MTKDFLEHTLEEQKILDIGLKQSRQNKADRFPTADERWPRGGEVIQGKKRVILIGNGCAYFDIEELKSTPKSNNEFAQALSESYLEFALYEMNEMHDEMDASYFAKKGINARKNIDTSPELINNWDIDDDVYTNDMNIAMTGDMVIRIAKGTTVARGDLLMSAGDGTAKPQGDDIVRSKTIAKVTSTNVSHTYDDGTYLVPCVIMAC